MGDNIKELMHELHKPFKANEIEWRVGQAGETNGRIWASCLAYVQSRAVMNRLDSVFGVDGWQDEYELVPLNGSENFICTLSCRIGDEWVKKQDGAQCTQVEPFKGGISDALKRAAVKYGIGRYLYRLESGFANIVDKQKGAKRGKTKQGSTFYWLPPDLPSWALPK